MVDDDGERLDWGHEDDEQQSPGSYSGYSPDQLGGYAGVPEDAEDAVSLGGDDEDEREYFANHSQEQGSAAPGAPSVAKTSSTASHPHPGKRDAQRLSATAPSRAPSRAKNSQSPSRESRPPNSSGKLPPAPLIHGLPPKPVLVPPLFEQPSEPGIRASAMVNNRPRKANGASKGLTAPDGGDPLPPDWEIRFPRNGGKDAYYYNVQTQESTWTRPRLPGSERASPTKNRENGSAQSSGRHSPEPQDDTWSQPTGRSQQARSTRRDPTSRRVSPPPNSDLSYDDRHYRPGEGPTSEGEDWRGTAGHPESTYGRGRSASPRPASDGRRGTRSSSPRWDRRARRELSQSPLPDREMWQESQRDYPQDRQAGVSDTGWIRSQEYPKPVQSAPRSSSTHRVRRKDDIESPVRRRKDDIEPTNRRKDDIEPRIRRKDDIEPPIRRKDDLGPRTRRKDDIEPPLRRKDDIEPPLRPLPSRETSSRHLNDEWQAPSTLFASSSSSSASSLSHRRSSQGGGQVLADCLVKPWESSCVAPYISHSSKFSCTYEDDSPGPIDSRFSVPLPCSCSSLLSLLLRTLFLFYCRTTFAAASSQGTFAPKATRPPTLIAFVKLRLHGSCIK